MKHDTLQILYDIFQIPIACWETELLFQAPGEELHDSPAACDGALRAELEAVCRKNDFPVLYLENEVIYYGLFRDDEGRMFCFGPVATKKIGKIDTEEYKRKHGVQGPLVIRNIGMGLMTKILALAFGQYTGQQVPYADIVVRSGDPVTETWNSQVNMEDYMLDQAENDRSHGRGIVFENEIMDIVRRGDVEAMKEAISSHTPELSDMGEVSPDYLRQMEYMLVVTLTLITRAAAEGGMNTEEAYTLGDVYMRRIEACRGNTGALNMLGLKAQLEFTEKVKAAQENKSQFVYIDRCKDYIAKNLRKDIKVGDIGPAIGISRSYLAHKFREAEGMTIQQYIMKEKCAHAANLLKYSDYSITRISEYFHFSSPSHFGNNFKQFYGMTPKDYRRLNSRLTE